jgi:hypothetical protein
MSITILIEIIPSDEESAEALSLKAGQIDRSCHKRLSLEPGNA